MSTTHTNGRVTITVVEHYRRESTDGTRQEVRDLVVLTDVQPRELMQEGYDLFHVLYPPPHPRVYEAFHKPNEGEKPMLKTDGYLILTYAIFAALMAAYTVYLGHVG